MSCSHQKLRNHDLCVTVNGKQLSRVSSVRYLGLHIDENLSWHQHIAMLFREFTLGYFVLIVYIPCPQTFLQNYIVFVLLIVDYCDVVWIPSSVQHFKHLERLHSKLPSGTDLSVSVTLTEQRFHAAVQVHRVLHKLSPSYLNGTFYNAIDITSCTSWNLYHLFAPRV